MATVTVTRTIDAPPTHVWALLTGLRSRKLWLPTTEDIELVTSGTFAAGTVWRETRTMADGTRVTEEFQVTDCSPPTRFVLRSPGIGADYRTSYQLTPVDVGRHRGGTAVTIEQEGHSHGPTGRFLEFVLGGLAVRTAEGALRQELDDLARAATGHLAGTARAA